MITITGATGHTGSKIVNMLLDKDKRVRAIGRSTEKLQFAREKGAELAVGDQSDVQFLTKAFSGSDAVYLLIPPKFDTSDVLSYYNLMGDVATEAIVNSGVKKVVFLSSFGAELNAGTGPVVGLHDVETKLEKLSHVDISFIRAAEFMENELWNIPLIKKRHIFGGSLPPNVPVMMIATRDIAKKAVELLDMPSFEGHSIIELFGDQITYREVTRLIGEGIGMPDLPYIQFPEAEIIKGMTDMGLSENLARSYIELSSVLAKGIIHPTRIDPLKPNTNTKFKEFVKLVFEPLYRNAT